MQADSMSTHAPLQDLTVRGGSTGVHDQVDVAPSVQRFTALRSLCLQPCKGVTPACIAALSPLKHLTSLTTDLKAPDGAQDPVDLVEYAQLTGAP